MNYKDELRDIKNLNLCKPQLYTFEDVRNIVMLARIETRDELQKELLRIADEQLKKENHFASANNN